MIKNTAELEPVPPVEWSMDHRDAHAVANMMNLHDGTHEPSHISGVVQTWVGEHTGTTDRLTLAGVDAQYAVDLLSVAVGRGRLVNRDGSIVEVTRRQRRQALAALDRFEDPVEIEPVEPSVADRVVISSLSRVAHRTAHTRQISRALSRVAHLRTV